jgi:hypothetical protein
MALNIIAEHDTLSFADLKTLAGCKSPCITIVTMIPNPIELPVRVKNAVTTVQKQLVEQGIDPALQVSLLQPMEEVFEHTESAGIWANALILLRSPDIFRYYFLYGQFKEQAIVANRFQIGAILSALGREQRFHLLALSRHNTRLLHCTPHAVEDEGLESVTPQDMRVWMNTQKPDHMLDGRSTAGPSVGSMKGVRFTTSSDRDNGDQDLTHFFKEVEKGVRTLLRQDTEPLILAGVDYEIASYRRVNSYPRLLEQAVVGSPDGLPDRELCRRARDLVMELPSAELAKALAAPERVDGSRITVDPVEIFNAATEGRVADLFLCDTLDGDGIAELMNTAAIETLRNSGRAFSLRAAEMPVDACTAAVLRF